MKSLALWPIPGYWGSPGGRTEEAALRGKAGWVGSLALSRSPRLTLMGSTRGSPSPGPALPRVLQPRAL